MPWPFGSCDVIGYIILTCNIIVSYWSSIDSWYHPSSMIAEIRRVKIRNYYCCLKKIVLFAYWHSKRALCQRAVNSQEPWPRCKSTYTIHGHNWHVSGAVLSGNRFLVQWVHNATRLCHDGRLENSWAGVDWWKPDLLGANVCQAAVWISSDHHRRNS